MNTILNEMKWKFFIFINAINNRLLLYNLIYIHYHCSRQLPYLLVCAGLQVHTVLYNVCAVVPQSAFILVEPKMNHDKESIPLEGDDSCWKRHDPFFPSLLHNERLGFRVSVPFQYRSCCSASLLFSWSPSSGIAFIQSHQTLLVVKF